MASASSLAIATMVVGAGVDVGVVFAEKMEPRDIVRQVLDNECG